MNERYSGAIARVCGNHIASLLMQGWSDRVLEGVSTTERERVWFKIFDSAWLIGCATHCGRKLSKPSMRVSGHRDKEMMFSDVRLDWTPYWLFLV